MGKICAVLNQPLVKEMVEVAKTVEADIFEIRLDHLGSDQDLNDLANIEKPLIVTCMPHWEGGLFQGKEEDVEGFEYDLAQKFATDHNLKAEFIIKDSIKDVLLGLENAEGDIGAAGLTITDKRLYSFSFSPSYFSSHQIVTCKSKSRLTSPSDLKNLKIVLPKDTSFTENLHILKKTYPKLVWEELEDTTSELMIQNVWKDEKTCTITDEHILNLHRRYMPELKSVYKFKGKDQIAWATKRKNTKLQNKINHWFQKRETKEHIVDSKRKYFEFIDFNAYNLKVFLSRIKSRLPKYKDTFLKAAEKYNLPWELLAAVGYQESYWNPEARSPTGVRGLMMLTRRTAKEVGVTNRLDATQSIMGGAKYLKKIMKRLPAYLDVEDHVWFALAAYNVGYYHLRDALALTILRNKNPTRWHSVQKVLPLLSHKKYYKRLPFGHARGL